MNTDQKQRLQQFINHAKEGDAARRALAVSLLDAHLDVSMTGYTEKHAQRLRRNFCLRGDDVFKDKRHNNRDRVLTRKERNTVIAQVHSRQPKELIQGCTDTHWSTHWLGEYIHTITGKRYKSKTSSYLIFREAKLTWHKPGKVYDKADPVKQDMWKEQTLPLLEKYWNDPNTVILCEDEMVLSIQSTIQKAWLPQGEYPPVIETTGTRKNKSFYGFLSLKTGQEHIFVTEYQNMYITRDILTQVRALYPHKHLLILWDNAGWHRGSQVTQWIQADGNTEVIWFPSYSPELNPQEHVWKAGRQAVTHNKQITNINTTAEQFKSHLESHTYPYELLGCRAEKMAQD